MMTETISCPYCNENEGESWAKENGFTAVKCKNCGFIYVNPRPQQSVIKESVKEGVHSYLKNPRSKLTRRIQGKIDMYRSKLKLLIPEMDEKQKVKWLDVGAGFGEVVEAATAVLPKGSYVMGVEPMRGKAQAAQARNINVVHGYLDDIKEKFDYVSVINVFSHIYNIRQFINQCYEVLDTHGEIILETGNIGDLVSNKDVPTELDLPDHLIFAGEKHIVGFLNQAGFEIITIKKFRRDTLKNFIKNIVKKAIGRQVYLRVPYTSPYRTIFVRARKINS